MLDEVLDASGALDVERGRKDVRIADNVLLDTGMVHDVVFKDELELKPRVEDEVNILKAGAMSLLVVFNVAVV